MDERDEIRRLTQTVQALEIVLGMLLPSAIRADPELRAEFERALIPDPRENDPGLDVSVIGSVLRAREIVRAALADAAGQFLVPSDDL